MRKVEESEPEVAGLDIDLGREILAGQRMEAIEPAEARDRFAVRTIAAAGGLAGREMP